MEDTIKVIIYLIIIVVAIISSFTQKKENDNKNGEFDGNFDLADFDFSKIGKPQEKKQSNPVTFQNNIPEQPAQEKHRQSEETPSSYIDYRDTYQETINATPASEDRGQVFNKKLCDHHNDNEKIILKEENVYESFEKAAAAGKVVDVKVQASGADIKESRQKHLAQRQLKATERYNDSLNTSAQPSFFKELTTPDSIRKAFIASFIFERKF
ncbi:MAG: hypothetical protein QMC67_09535 [Candidatus Wallbacteria bacterium]